MDAFAFDPGAVGTGSASGSSDRVRSGRILPVGRSYIGSGEIQKQKPSGPTWSSCLRGAQVIGREKNEEKRHEFEGLPRD